ncbi:MAG: TRAP transporter substrate-binding protein [Desulfitobacterium hafniense]|nr:TRAP transporter substrate-binding protein [Desulfitobacterium hafniense]
MRRFAKLTAVAVTGLLLAVTVVGCGSSQPAPSTGGNTAAKKVVLKAGSTPPESHPYNLGLKKFKEIVEKETNGSVEVQIFPNSALGGEREMVEGLQIGSVDVVVTSTGPLGNFVPQMNVVDLPFLFRDNAHAWKVLDGPIGQDLLKKFEAKGIVGLAVWENGFRNVTNSKREIKTPEDLKGLKLRTMENKVHMAAFKAMGADPTPMAMPEVFTALQNKTIDGQENPIPIIAANRMEEVQKYVSLTGHVYSPAPLLISKTTFDKLTKEQQDAIKKAALEARDYERQQIQKQVDEESAKLKTKGMIFTTVDKKLFQDATASVYKQYENEFGKDLIDKILNTK